jgi:hypothetical protein
MMRKVLVLVAASVAISTAALAQDTRSDSEACRDTASVQGLYRRCALWIDGNKVRRGEEGIVVGRPGIFSPLRMSRLVAGDSAMRYAQLFEHRSKQSGGFLFVGSALLVASEVVLGSRECHVNIIGACDYRDNHDFVAGSLFVGGLGFTIPGAVLAAKARSAGARAVWWNNSRFAR